jgi:hypothetical protein
MRLAAWFSRQTPTAVTAADSLFGRTKNSPRFSNLKDSVASRSTTAIPDPPNKDSYGGAIA